MLDRIPEHPVSHGNATTVDSSSRVHRRPTRSIKRVSFSPVNEEVTSEVITSWPEPEQLADAGTASQEPIAVPGLAPLVIVHIVEGCRGGVGTAVKHLIEQQKHDPLIGAIHLFADPDRMGEMLSDAPAVFHWYRSSRRPHEVIRISHILQKELHQIKPDLVYLHSTFPGLYGRMRLKKKGSSWATLYCPHGWAFTQSVSFPKRIAYALIERALASRADAIISISQDELRQATRNGIHHARHRVILHGVPPVPEPVLPAIKHTGNGLNLLFVGRFDPQKGVDFLLEAWRDPRLKDIHLWLIGDSTLGQKISIPAASNVHPLGWIRHDQIDSYIRSFDAVIVPSRWEAFGLVVLEAMRNGRPVVASRIGGLRELVIDGVNGILFEPDQREELISILTHLDKPRLAQMGEVASEVFRAGFEWPSGYARWRRLAVDAIEYRRTAAQPLPAHASERWLHRFAKRAIDITASIAALSALMPFLLVLAAAVKLTSRGPILFGHTRCGRNGKTFRIWKFRTMVLDADRVLEEYLRENVDAMQEWSTDYKLRRDPRVTPLGRLMRRYSLDEIPQLLNVLAGHMSLVGPRPIVQMEVERYAEIYDLYTRVKPGITGLWQVSGRNNTTYAERVAFDAFYVRNWSLWLDLSIILRTFVVVVAARGSY